MIYDEENINHIENANCIYVKLKGNIIYVVGIIFYAIEY
jgi:hypothetical protein